MTYTDIYFDLYGGSGVITPPPPPGPLEFLVWMEPDGTLTPLLDDIVVVQGVNGLRVPTARRSYVTVAGQPGQRLVSLTDDMRTADVPVMFVGVNEADLRIKMRFWEHRFDPTRGTGQFQIDTVDGKSLTWNCRCVDGLGGNEDETHRFAGEPVRLAVCVFEGDPYWYEKTPAIATWALGGSTSQWFNPSTSKSLLPIQLGASSIGGTNTVLVDGQVAVFPVWRISGPATTVTLRNETTGRELIWSGNLTAGQQLVIDTRDGEKTVLLDGQPAYAFLQSWDMWPLEPGSDVVTAQVLNATAATTATLSWQPGWRGY